MQITRTSKLTGVVHTQDIPITEEQLAAYENGALIQVAFPHLDADQREFLKSGITPQEWDQHLR
jgi:hypothetical protein